MKNENNSLRSSRPNLFRNGPARQAPVAPRLKRPINRWRAPVTAEYLGALREADELIFQAILRGTVLRHSGRMLKA